MLNKSCSVNLVHDHSHSYFTTNDMKEVLKTALPFTLTNVINAAANFSTTIILSHLGEEQFAASGLITSGLVIMQGFLFSPLYSVGVVASRAQGNNDKPSLLKINQQGLIFASLLSVPYIMISSFSGEIFIAMGQDIRISQITQDFFNGYMIGSWADVILNTSQQYAVAIGRQNAVLSISLLQKLSTIGLGVVLTHGLIGAPKLEAFGLGLAFALPSILALIVTNAYLISKKELNLSDYIACDNLYERFKTLKNMMSIGAPISIHVGFELASLSAMIACSGLINNVELVSSQIAIQYDGLIAVPIIGLSQAVAMIVSKAIGAEDLPRAKRYANISFLLGFIFSAVSTILMCTLTYPLTRVFVDSNDMNADKVYSLTRNLLFINAASLLPDFFRNNSIGALRGLYDTNIPMFVNAGLSLVNIGLAYLAFKTDMKSYGIFGSRTFIILVIAIILTVRWVYKINSFDSGAKLASNNSKIDNTQILPDEATSLLNSLESADRPMNPRSYGSALFYPANPSGTIAQNSKDKTQKPSRFNLFKDYQLYVGGTSNFLHKQLTENEHTNASNYSEFSQNSDVEYLDEDSCKLEPGRRELVN